jgi:hypothetical protein
MALKIAIRGAPPMMAPAGIDAIRSASLLVATSVRADSNALSNHARAAARDV